MAICIWSNEISWIYYWDTNWTPDPTRTLLYLKFNNNLNDDSWNNVSVTWAWIWYGTIGNNHYVEMTSSGSGCSITPPPSIANVIWTWDYTVSFWIYSVPSTYYSTWEWAMAFGVWYDWANPRPWIYLFIHQKINSGTDKINAMEAELVDHPFTTSASTLNNSWHNIVITRDSWVVKGYLDGVQEMSATQTRSFNNCDTFFILNRSNFSWQQWKQTWAKMSEVIFEKVKRTSDDVNSYYNNTKSNYINV